MTKNEKWEFILALDDKLLKGGVILPEWCSFIVREADVAFVNEANLAAVLTATSAIETYLRSEFSSDKKESFYDLIKKSDYDQKLKSELNTLRIYRNKWVHVESPWEDQSLLDNPTEHEQELLMMAEFSICLMRKVIYSNQFV